MSSKNDKGAELVTQPTPNDNNHTGILASEMGFVKDDGGRAKAGYLGDSGDCVTRAIAIAAGKPYQEVYDALNGLAKSERTGIRKRKISSSRTGVYRSTYEKYLLSLGAQWTPTMQIGKGCKVHLKSSELPQSGRLVVSLSRHLTAVIDGVIHDIFDPSRKGTRCVYGYYQFKPKDIRNKVKVETQAISWLGDMFES